MDKHVHNVIVELCILCNHWQSVRELTLRLNWCTLDPVSLSPLSVLLSQTQMPASRGTITAPLHPLTSVADITSRVVSDLVFFVPVKTKI